MVVAVVGAYGGIGQNICRGLLALDGVEVKAIGRNRDEAKKKLGDIWTKLHYESVDIKDISALEDAIKDAEVLINAAGVEENLEGEMILMCQRKNIKYISTGKVNKAKDLRNCIFDAGSMPGLSQLIPRAMAKSMGEAIEELKFCYCVQDSFSRNAARDYIEGLFDNEKKMMVTYDNGELIPFTEDDELSIPYLEGKKKNYPFFDQESKALVRELNLKKGIWSMVLEGERTMKVLEECRMLYKEDKELATDKLCRASSLDTFEHGRYSAIYIELKTESKKDSCFIRCNTSGELTALATKLCITLLKRGKLKDFYGSFGEIQVDEDIIPLLQELAHEVVYESNSSEDSELLLGEI